MRRSPRLRRREQGAPESTTTEYAVVPLELVEQIAQFAPQMLYTTSEAWKSVGGISHRLLLAHEHGAPFAT